MSFRNMGTHQVCDFQHSESQTRRMSATATAARKSQHSFATRDFLLFFLDLGFRVALWQLRDVG
jgi:hypothetical protein